MISEEDDEIGLTADLRRPVTLLRAAEDRAVKTAKFLHAIQPRLSGRLERASVDDAVLLAETIIALAGHGRKQTADQAVEIADQVEILMDLLAAELEGLI